CVYRQARFVSSATPQYGAEKWSSSAACRAAERLSGGLAGLCLDLCREVLLLLFNAFTDFHATVVRHCGVCLRQQLFHSQVRILDERLTQQRDLAEILAQTPLDHLFDDV